MVPYTMLELDPDATWSQDSEGPSPSNDIWKKFELIPTPPRSPLRDSDFDLANTKSEFDLSSIPDDLLASFDLPLLEGDELDLALDAVELEDSLANFNFGDICSHGVKQTSCQSCNQLAQAGSELKHDCMWVGICTDRSHTFTHQENVGVTRTHRDSCLHMLMDQSSSLVETAGFTHLAELETNDTDDEDSQMEEEEEVDHITSNSHNQSSTISRPDTPSESSDTDTDCEPEQYQDTLDVCREEEVSTSEYNNTNVIHVDHSYHCVRIPTPEDLPVSQPRPAYTNSTLHTPSDSEDEIDVVSVNSLDSTSSTTTTSTSTSRSRKSYNSSISIADSVHDTKSLKVRPGSLPTNPSRRARKELQQAMSQGVKRRGQYKRRSNGMNLKAPKRLHGSNGRRRGSPRSDSDDPEKRQMHNSLERMRRVDLRNAFEEVRSLVPELQDREKAPKVEILKKAADFCKFVTKQDQHMAQERERLRRYQQELKRKKAALERRSLY